MFYMQSCFDLREGIGADAFSEALADFDQHLRNLGLVVRTDPLGQRVRHPVMDTDEVRDQTWCFLMTFRDRGQCDRAVAHFQSGDATTDRLHGAVHGKIENHVFYCWEDDSGNE